MSGKQPEKKKKQTTLFNTKGFTKTIKHQGEDIDVSDRCTKFTEDDPALLMKCDKCPSKFKTTQALRSHDTWAHQLPILKPGAAGDQSMKAMLSPASKKRSIIEDGVKFNWRKVCLDIERKHIRDEDKEQRAKGWKGASERKSYDNLFKVDVIQQLERGELAINIAENNNVSKSLVSKWYKSRQVIYDMAAIQHRKLMKKNRLSSKHNPLFKELIEKFRKTRGRGGKVSFSWIYTNANMINMILYPGASRLSKSIVVTFLKKYSIKLCHIQRKKQESKGSHTATLMNWHGELREGLIKTGSKRLYYHPKWGHYTPERCWNVDQVPMESAINRKTTDEEPVEKESRKDHKVWVAQPGSGLDKRQCSLQ